MGYVKYSTMALTVAFIAACSSEQPPAPPAKTVFDPMTQQIDRARAVQNTVDAQADSTRKAIEAQEHDGTAP
jgi:hypothetical protein